MFGKKSIATNALSGQYQIDKRKEIISRISTLIFKWKPERIATREMSDLVLDNLRAACDILSDIYIERGNSQIIWIYYSEIISNIEILELQQYSDKYEVRSRLDMNFNSDKLILASSKILNISQQWKETK